MNREELAALHAALAAVLGWPDNIRETIGRWLASEAAWPAPASKPNGQDHDPPSRVTPKTSTKAQPRPANIERLAAANEKKARAVEQKLLSAMRDNPGLSERALASAVGASRSSAAERLRRLCEAGVVEKDGVGRWRVAGESARPTGPP
jgi:Winged helix-turn-helix DNA-binding